MSAAQRIYDDIVDLFARGGGAPSVLSFRPSPESVERVRELLTKSKEAALTEEERDELERFAEIERLMQLVKARARRLVA